MRVADRVVVSLPSDGRRERDRSKVADQTAASRYIPYLVLSCMAVQRHRNIKRDMAHQSATVNLEEFAPREDSTFRPKDNDQV